MRARATGHEAETSWLGIGLTLTSAALMPAFGIAKQRVGAKLGSAATRSEGTQNMLCAYLSLAVLAGLLGNALPTAPSADDARAGTSDSARDPGLRLPMRQTEPIPRVLRDEVPLAARLGALPTVTHQR